MKALVWHGAKDVRVDNVGDPTIIDPDDIVIRITATAICGSDLHLYRGKTAGLKEGDVLGHEFMGVVEATGPGVTQLRRGDRVVVPFTISCGDCFFCEHELFAACETTNPGPGGTLQAKGLRPGAGMFGYTHLYGGYAGGQAEFARVPKANVGPLVIPEGLDDERVLFLSDILPTGYQAVLNANASPGGNLAIFGAGPVGLMSAACARLVGVDTIFMVDHNEDRLQFAATTYGVIPIDASKVDDPAAEIVALTHGRGVDGAIDAVGYEAKAGPVETAMTALKIEQSSGAALRQAIACTRRGGHVSVAGVYLGMIHGFPHGDAFEKGLTIRGGQTHVQRYLPTLLRHVREGELRPEAIISHRLPLAEAAKGYEMFNDAADRCRKVVLRP